MGRTGVFPRTLKMRMQANPKTRAQRVDRWARRVITAAGAIVIAAVILILVLIAAEAVPLFRGAGKTLAATFPAREGREAPPPLAVGIDDYLENGYVLLSDGAFQFLDLATGAPRGARQADPPAGASAVRAVDPVGTGDYALLWDTGAVTVERVRLVPSFTDAGEREIIPELRRLGVFPPPAGAARRSIRASVADNDSPSCLSLLEDDRLVVQFAVRKESLFGEATTTLASVELPLPRPATVTGLAVNATGNRLAAGTADGVLLVWEVTPEGGGRLMDEARLNEASSPVSALQFVYGGESIAVADQSGNYDVYSLVPVTQGRADRRLARLHRLPRPPSPVVGLVASRRHKAVMGVTAAGGLVFDHVTSERRLLTLPPDSGIAQAALSQRANGFVTLGQDGAARAWALDNPHPETSWSTLFGKVWYEGYAGPRYVWQSSSASDDFEPKLSLVPLIFGSVKGTLYAMIFAVPLAVFGALYTSQLTRPEIREVVKPSIEIMAAIPSVIIGFLAALWLAPIFERNLGAVFLSVAVLPLSVLGAILAWQGLRRIRVLRPVERGHEFLAIAPVVVGGVILAGVLGHVLEGALFGGDLKQWLWREHAVRYDPRNCVVIAFALGFAVIPIIFSISEDAFTNVPRSLTAASLALGASRWQTAWRVVLPSASPGVFAGLMIGLGRAVGETMIVLMATGNTPIIDWSILNGMRTLSANIAVEIPEAPHGGTLYRVLFLSAMVLFLMTFALNTLAETVRHRLREKYARFQ